MAPATAETASSWPMTRSCSFVLEVDELLHLAPHHLGHRDAGPGGHHLGDFLLRHLLPKGWHRPPACRSGPVLPAPACAAARGYGRSESPEAFTRSPSRVARSSFGLRSLEIGLERLNVLDDVLFVLPFGLALRQGVFRVGDFLAQMLKRRSRLTSSVSFISACSSICIWVSLRSARSTSSGMLSISMRRRLAASSMRSMALSGRKRSEM